MKVSANSSVFSTAQGYFADPELAVSVRSDDTTGSLIKRMLGRVINVQASLEHIRSSLLVHAAVFKIPAAVQTESKIPNDKGPSPRRLAKSLAAQLKEASHSLKEMFENFDRLGQDGSLARTSIRQAILTPFASILHREFPNPVDQELSAALGITDSLDDNSIFLTNPNEGLLRHALAARSEHVLDFLLADEPQRQGLFPSLLGAMQEIQTSFTNQLGSTQGLLLDAWA